MSRERKADYLYQQLKARTAGLRAGDRFPSVRELAAACSLSPQIVKQALRRLAEEGVLESRIGSGTYLTGVGGKRQLRILALSPNWHGYSPDIECHLSILAAERGDQLKTVIYHYGEGFYRNLPYHEADAIILRAHGGALSDEDREALANAPVPVVFVKATLDDPRLNCVGGDNAASGRLAAEYLTGQGHRALAFIQSELPDTACRIVYDSFCRTARRNGAAVQLIQGDDRYGEDLAQKTYALLCGMFRDRRPDFTAAFCISDVTTLGVIKAFQVCGLRLPQEMSLLGFGGDQMAALFTPALSVVEVSRRSIAEAAYQIIEDALTSGTLTGYKHKVAPVITERESICRKQEGGRQCRGRAV